MFVFWICVTLLVLPLLARTVAAHPGHSHQTRSPLPETWFQPRDHPVHSLFRRQTGTGPTDGITYAQVGSPTWAAAYPASTPDANAMPQAWQDALSAAVQAGTIPNIPPTSNPNNGNPVYPSGYDPLSPQVCSATYQCRIAGDIWDAPPGVIGISFDDGPLPPQSGTLYSFLQANNVKATHFFIGINILNNAELFLRAFNTNQDDIAVHTWTHPHMTTLSNEDVVAQLAWTIELIHNSTSGLVPRFWRPPYGDTDVRVSAIAKEVFGLTTVVWNQDTEDWTLGMNGTGTTTMAQIHADMQTWLTGPKTPGLIILEHELSNESVQAFIDNYPLIHANNWEPVSVARLDGLNAPYQNAQEIIVATSTILQNHTSSTPPSSSTTLSTTTSSSTPTAPDSSVKGNGAGLASNSASAVLMLTMAVLAGVLVLP